VVTVRTGQIHLKIVILTLKKNRGYVQDRDDYRMERDKRLALEKKIKALRVKFKTKTVENRSVI
jgi:hypothetical protein